MYKLLYRGKILATFNNYIHAIDFTYQCQADGFMVLLVDKQGRVIL